MFAVRVGVHFRSILWGTLLLLGIVAAAVGYGFLIYRPHTADGHRSAEEVLLMLCSPLLACVVVYGFFFALGIIRRGLTRYTLGNDLQIHGLLLTRVIHWRDVVDFEIPPASFPRPPTKLVLIFSDDRREIISIPHFHAHGADVVLREKVGGLAEHGLDRVRPNTTRTIPSWRVRWSLYAGDFVPLGLAAIFGVIFLVGGLALAWDYVNYLRLQVSGVNVQATVLKIDVDHDSTDEDCHATVRYTVPGGRRITLRRKVPTSFEAKVRKGALVTVSYLPMHPSIGRIRDWDLDAREWIILLLILPLVPLFLAAAQRMLRWFQPLRENFRWSTSAEIPAILLGKQKMEDLYPAFPAEHEGQLVLEPPRLSDSKPGVFAWNRTLGRNGFSPRILGDTFVLLSREETSRLMGRVGGETTLSAPYFILDCPDTDHAAQFTLARLGQGNLKDVIESGDRTLRFFSEKSLIGPFDAAQRRVAFDRYIRSRLARLYGGALPRNATYPDVARLFSFDPASGTFDLLLERRHATPRIWFRNEESDRAAYADCVNGRWIVTSNQKIPEPMRHRKAIAKLARLCFLPVIIPCAIVIIPFVPVFYWLSQRQKKAIAKDLEAMNAVAK